MGQRPQEVGVDADACGSLERANSVFAIREIDAGLSSNGGIDHAKQCSGDQPKRNPPEISAGHKCCEVSDGSAAQADQGTVPVKPCMIELSPQRQGMFNGLDGLADNRHAQEFRVRREKGRQ